MICPELSVALSPRLALDSKSGHPPHPALPALLLISIPRMLEMIITISKHHHSSSSGVFDPSCHTSSKAWESECFPKITPSSLELHRGKITLLAHRKCTCGDCTCTCLGASLCFFWVQPSFMSQDFFFFQNRCHL